MGPKYEFTGETMTYASRLLHRIRRIEDDKLGGWIESEDNLSQEGNCWVDDNAKVYSEAKVYGEARVYDEAEVYGLAKVYGNAKVYKDAWVHGFAKVYGNAQVYGNAYVYGYAEIFCNAQVYGHARVYSKAKLYDDAAIYGCAEVFGNAKVYDDAEVYGLAKVCGEAEISGNVKVSGNTKVCDVAKVHDDSTKVAQDFIYKIDDSDKLNVKTEYSSIDEYFNSDYQNDIKLDTLIIGTVDTKISLIKIEKVEIESKTEFKFIVDITNEKGSNFSFKSVIKDAEQLNSLVTQTIEALNAYPEFTKYVDALADCL